MAFPDADHHYWAWHGMAWLAGATLRRRMIGIQNRYFSVRMAANIVTERAWSRR
jgi:hypothetical protein